MRKELSDTFKNYAAWISEQYEISGSAANSEMIRDIIVLIESGEKGDQIQFHSSIVKYENAVDFLYSMVTHPKALQDSIPHHIEPNLWLSKLLDFGRMIK